MNAGRYRLGGLTVSAVRYPWWRPRGRRRQTRWCREQRANGLHITMHPAPTVRATVQRHAFNRMVDALKIVPGALVPDLREWPVRAFAWALLNPAGRLHLEHRFRARTAIPGDRVRDPLRMVNAVVVRVPRPGTAVLACATDEALHYRPRLLDPPPAELAAHPMYLVRGLVATADGLQGSLVPCVWQETVDLRDWRRI
jgi:hypothetical protein